MAEYIDRDKIIRAIMQWEDKPYFSYYAVLRDVMNLPFADVIERKHGKWMHIIDGNEYGDVFQSGCYCSECGEDLQCEPNFCPNCGADMRKSEGEE